MSDEPSVTLETTRLRLRPLDASDLDDLVELDSDPEVLRFITDGRPRSREEVVASLERVADVADRFPGLGFFAAERRDGGRFLGWFHLRPWQDDPNELELGYRLRRDAWGQGYATEGSAALVRLGFERFGARRIVATAVAANAGSRRVMAKVGLRFESTFEETRFPGTDQRAVFYALDRPGDGDGA